MPVENEFKFVLRPSKALDLDILETFGSSYDLVRQGYLNPQTRVRRSEFFGEDIPPIGHANSFTFKQKIEGQQGVIEIETSIEDSDFDALWPLTTNRLEKRRYHTSSFQGQGIVSWDIDFFLKDSHTYFVLAECEVPASQTGIESNLHEVVERHFIHAVEPGDLRFTSRELSDPEKAAQLLKELAQ